ncbi:c6 zinc finger domain-containing protein [Dactylonectria estremocensis]|uniref:C6 zinc finger domain-containing protein n=1 Tax=Dactylonectria estremocensis TaxID=1079267 RepID=A0A9P9IT83_9HYPO|nr:c6 zinc finger domain-containing protein [Dactylonectria estremocensis]
MQACDRCHARKTRCDRRIPQCSACEKAGAACVHADKLRQRNLPRGYLDNIETLVAQLRDENKLLRDSLATARAEMRAQNNMVPSNEPSTSHTNPTPSSQPSQTRDPSDVTSPRDGDGAGDGNGGTPDSNAFAVEVGYLTLIATGETRYLGSSSGLGLANVINTVINLHGGMGASNADPHEPIDCGDQRIPMGPSDLLFPSLATARPIIEAYFQHTHIAFPLIHRPSFLATVDSIYSEPNFYETHVFDAFVFDMVLTIGSSNFNRFQEISANSSLYFAMAQSKIASIAIMPSLESLKVLLLVSQHGIFSNLRETDTSVWHLAGLGARMCFELGLHLERKPSDGDPTELTSPLSITFDQEMRKRCFWCLYNLDRIVSITLGRPVVIRDEEIDVTLPSHLDDHHFGVNQPIQVDRQDSSVPTNISPFLHIIRIRRISGQILNRMYISRQHANISPEEKHAMRCKLHEELDAWKRDTERLQLIPTDPRGYSSSFIATEWYSALYNNAILLLYRPSPYLPEPTTEARCRNGESEITCLINAARTSIESYSQLHQKRRINYSWITLHGIFIAGLAYIYGTRRLLDNPSTRQLVPNIMDMIEVTQACSHVLVAICERWNGSRRSCELFSKLSTNLIRDALHPAAKENTHAQAGTAPSPPLSIQNNSLRPAQGNNSGGLSYTQTNLHEPQTEIGGVDSTTDLDNDLIMESFKEYQGFFDFTFQGDYLNSAESMSSASHAWALDPSYSTATEADTIEIL